MGEDLGAAGGRGSSPVAYWKVAGIGLLGTFYLRNRGHGTSKKLLVVELGVLETHCLIRLVSVISCTIPLSPNDVNYSLPSQLPATSFRMVGRLSLPKLLLLAASTKPR